MKWFPFPKYKPSSNSGECLVTTDEMDLWIAIYQYCDEIDEYAWIAECDGMRLNSVTHFIIPDAIPVED